MSEGEETAAALARRSCSPSHATWLSVCLRAAGEGDEKTEKVRMSQRNQQEDFDLGPADRKQTLTQT